MTAFEILGLLLTLAALFAYVNFRWLRLPPAIGLMAVSLTASLLLIVVDKLGWWSLQPLAARVLERVAFGDTLLHGMLGVLLFAGAIHIDLNDLRAERTAIAILAVGSTVVSTLMIAGLAYIALAALGTPLRFGACMLFGAVIAPTDPIGVLGILKAARIGKRLETQIAGESLFNDGVGVVLFLSILGVVAHGEPPTVLQVAATFLREVGGGIAFGAALGYAGFRLLKSIDHYQTELLITLALVLGGYALADRLGISAAIAAVVSGLLIGNQGRLLGMSDVTRDHVDKFWMLIDEVLNTILFALVGFELIRLTLTTSAVVAGLIAVPIVLVARFISVAAPIAAVRRWVHFARGAIPILTWGGLRGGISVALALSLPAMPEREIVVTITYFVVVFSVLVQGLSLRRLVLRYSNDGV